MAFPDLWVWFSENFQDGYTFKKFLQMYGYTFEILRIYGWYFHDSNGTTPYLGNTSDPPPRGLVYFLVGNKEKPTKFEKYCSPSKFNYIEKSL